MNIDPERAVAIERRAGQGVGSISLGFRLGGLVARSACRYAEEAGHAWRKKLDKLVFLGAPHHGAPLERIGNWVDVILGKTPYAAAFGKLGKIRSAGVTDLRYGNLLDEDWKRYGLLIS
jgi:hypothetical protein